MPARFHFREFLELLCPSLRSEKDARQHVTVIGLGAVGIVSAIEPKKPPDFGHVAADQSVASANRLCFFIQSWVCSKAVSV